MTTTAAATRTPTTDPMGLVYFDPMRHGGHTRAITTGGHAACQAVTQTGKACDRRATAITWGDGPRRSGHITLCRSHAASRYLVTADPSL